MNKHNHLPTAFLGTPSIAHPVSTPARVVEGRAIVGNLMYL